MLHSGSPTSRAREHPRSNNLPRVNDDWRLRVTLPEHTDAHQLAGHLAATELEHDVVKSMHDRVIMSRDDNELFCYAGTRDQVEQAQAAIRSIAEEHGWEAEYELKHWHPTAEQWEDPDVPLPTDDASRAAEHAELVEQEREETAEHGYPDFEI